jgi:hypothetical protein
MKVQGRKHKSGPEKLAVAFLAGNDGPKWIRLAFKSVDFASAARSWKTCEEGDGFTKRNRS